MTLHAVVILYNIISSGETPLHLAVISGNLESVRMLLNAGAQVHLCEQKRGANPLHLAVMHSHHVIARYLLEHVSVPCVFFTKISKLFF